MPETLTPPQESNSTTVTKLTTPVRFQIPGLLGAPAYGAGRLGSVGMESAIARAVDSVLPFDTLGWDTVFAIPAPKVNNCFAKPNAYPTSFQATLSGALATVVINGNFQPWTITTGGSGALISLNLPLASGTATVTAQSTTTYPLTGGNIPIQIALQYLQETTKPWSAAIASASRTSSLTTIGLSAVPAEPLAIGQSINQTGITSTGSTSFNGTAVVTAVLSPTSYQYTDAQANDNGKGGTAALSDSIYNLYLNNTPAPGAQAVTVLSNLTIPNVTDTEILGLIGQAFSQFLNANLGLIDAVFNTVNLDMQADVDAFQWLKPTSVGYAYYEPTGETNIDNAIFAVLCMVNNNSSSGNSFEIAPGAIPTGVQSGFSVGLEAFLSNMVLPTLPATIGNGAQLSYFALGAENTEVINTQTIPMKSVTVAATSYTPELETLKITVTGSTLVVYTLVHVNISPGIDTYVETTTSLTLSLVTASDGSQTLGFTQVGTPVQNHWNCVATWIHITEAVIVIIGIILVAVGGVILTVPAAVIAGVIIGLIAGLAALTPELIAWIAGGGSASQVGTAVQLVVEATNPYIWPGGQQFQITAAQLNGTLQLGGNAYPVS